MPLLRSQKKIKTYSLYSISRLRLLKFLSWFILILLAPMFVISAVALVVFLIEVLAGSTANDAVGNLGIWTVIAFASGIGAWAGMTLATKEVRLSNHWLRISTNFWFKKVNRSDITKIDVERSPYREFQRVVPVVVLSDGQRIEITSLTVAAVESESEKFARQNEVVSQLRVDLRVAGTDSASPPSRSTQEMASKPVRLLPQERLLMKFFGAKIDKNKGRSNAVFEATHGARGRQLLNVGSLQISASAACWLVYVLISTRFDNLELWPGYLVFLVFFLNGFFRMIQAYRSRPDSDPKATTNN